MKKYILIPIVILLLNTVSAQNEIGNESFIKDDVNAFPDITRIIKAFEAGDATSLITFFIDEIELIIVNSEGFYSKEEAGKSF